MEAGKEAHMGRGAWWVGSLIVSGAASAAMGGEPDEQEQLRALLEEHARRAAAGEELPALEARIDALAGARDAAFSGLYWHRDLASARAEAERRGRPILSLRLLGGLDCERSCANSRFFRTALYANAELAAWLRERVVLHWESVRPVPVITIDMGDGRRIERTITGNSIHWLLLPDGAVVDAFPGLYGPQAFAAALRPSVEAAERALRLEASARPAALRRHQGEALRQLEALGALAFPARAAPPGGAGRHPTAREAAPLAMGKAMVERPLIAALDGGPPPAGDPAWDVAGRWFRERCRLDARSRALMARKCTPAQREPAAFVALVARFEELMARDTAQNELGLRPRLLGWLVQGAGADLPALNRRVYAELFRTPGEDPWLGLAALEDFAALEGGGLVER